MKKWVLLLNLVLSMMGMGQVWLVQLSSYPLWAYVGPHEFHGYHIAWWHSIWGPVFIPAGLAMVITTSLFWLRPAAVRRSLVWAAVVMLLVVYTLTYVWWAPLMALIGATPAEFEAVFKWGALLDALGMRNKTQGQLYDLLMATHWLRVALFSAYAAVIFWMTMVAFDLKKQTANSRVS
ncbi:MAG TPA: hypothetical protein VFE53_05195 [Mucilaginibacter sp.]|jgi:hypothetical protein|nr:hypothetical protein [Mucilaginibacter sp.]